MTDKLRSDLEDLAATLDRVAESARLEATVSRSAPTLTPDEPIRSSKEDRLNRTGFATEVARAVVDLERTESIVIGIHGKWGTGKTSLLNLIEEKLQGVSPTPPVIFRFNPWGFSDQDQLNTQFFQSLSEFLKLHKTIGPLAGIAETVEAYGTLLSPVAHFVSPRAAQSLAAGWRIFRRFRPPVKTATELKAQINSALSKSKLRLIIVMDDIDRLNAIEIRQTFQLIKVNANFLNTLYLVAFDVEPVLRALAAVAPGPPKEYLEKIIQVAFNLPPIPQSTITEMVIANFNEVLGDRVIDTQRFGNMFHSGFVGNFRTIRDVNRYFNLFRFAFNVIRDDTNFIDLAAVQALSLFHPEIFRSIELNPDMFSGTWSWTSNDRPDKGELKPNYDNIFNQVPEEQRQSVVSLCRFLFPKVEYVYGQSHTFWGSDWIRIWEKEKRVGTEKYFRYYFELAVPDTDVRQAELDEAVGSAKSVDSFVRTLASFEETKRFGAFVDLLRNHLDSLDQTQVLTVLESIFVYGDQVSNENSGGFLGSVSDFVRFGIWLLFDLLDRLGEGRFDHVLEFMANRPAIFTITNVASMCDQILSEIDNPSRRNQREKYPDLTSETVSRMKASAVQAISKAADDGRLKAVATLPFVLLKWKQWGDPAAPAGWIRGTFLRNSRSALEFASKFLQPVRSMSISDRVPKTRNVMNLKVLSEFVELNAMSELIEAVPDDALDEAERATRVLFRSAKAKLDAGVDPSSPAALMDDD